MPEGATRAFLLWHDAARRGWHRLLTKPLTRDRWLALLLLQTYPPYQPGMEAAFAGPSPPDRRALEQRAREAIADGWGQ